MLLDLPSGPLTEDLVREEVHPLFSRVLSGEAERGEVYLANHSLGRPLDRMAEDVAGALEVWYSQMDRSWEGEWMNEIGRFRSNTAKLLGLSRADAVVPKTSAGQGLRAVLNSFPQDRPVRVVATTGEFDSIDFILKTYAHAGRAEVTWVGPSRHEGPVPIYEAEEIADRLDGADLLVVSLVFFTSGQVLAGLDELIKAAHEKGAVVLVDLYHAAGVLPLDLEAMGVDFGIGGSYKYLRGGPGACWLAVHPRHLDGSRRTLDTGWFAKRDTFRYERPEEPLLAEGGDAWLESTPPVLLPYQARAGLEFTLAVGVERLREYGLGRLALLRRVFTGAGLPVFVPEDPSSFGAFALLPAENASELSKRLREAGVNTDARGGFVRFGPDLLTTKEEIARSAEIVARTL